MARHRGHPRLDLGMTVAAQEDALPRLGPQLLNPARLPPERQIERLGRRVDMMELAPRDGGRTRTASSDLLPPRRATASPCAAASRPAPRGSAHIGSSRGPPGRSAFLRETGSDARHGEGGTRMGPRPGGRPRRCVARVSRASGGRLRYLQPGVPRWREQSGSRRRAAQDTRGRSRPSPRRNRGARSGARASEPSRQRLRKQARPRVRSAHTTSRPRASEPDVPSPRHER